MHASMIKMVCSAFVHAANVKQEGHDGAGLLTGVLSPGGTFVKLNGLI